MDMPEPLSTASAGPAGSAPPAVLVRVPATSANLGPGFDALGMALDLGLEVRIRGAAEDLVQGDAPDPDLPPAADNLLFRAADAVFRAVGRERPPFEMTVRSDIPVARGLGSSAAAVVAGLVGANTWLGDPLGEDALLELAAGIEGHPDNVVPALAGGVTVAALAPRGQVRHVRIPVHPAVTAGLGLALVIPAFRLATAVARGALPAQVPHRDATFNAGRAALLVAALATGRLDLLPDALEDRLHQPFRSGLVPGLAAAMASGVACGAFGVTISGAGPTLLAWCPRERRAAIGQAMAGTWGGQVQVRAAEMAVAGAQTTPISER